MPKTNRWEFELKHREAVARKVQKAEALQALLEEWEAEELRRSLTEEEQEYIRDLRHRHRSAQTQLAAMAQ